MDLPSAERYFSFRALLNRELRTALFSEQFRHETAGSQVERDCGAYFHASNATDPLDRAMYQDLKVYLPDDILANTDRISMLHSLEVRVPFLDHKVMEFCATIPASMKIRGRHKKYLFKKAVAPLLPQEILRKRKQGFVGPMAYWLRHDLKEYVRDTLSEASLKSHGYFHPQSVTGILDEHFARRKQHDTLIWALLVFQEWHHHYMGPSAKPGQLTCRQA